MTNKTIIFFDGDGTIWYPKNTKRKVAPHWIYSDKEIGEKLKVQTYACNPYHSWEKGTVENMNKRIRRFIPKGISVEEITQEYLDLLEDKLNNTPRKCLNYLTPNEFQKKLLMLPEFNSL